MFNLPVDVPDSAPNTCVSDELKDCAKLVNGEAKSMPLHNSVNASSPETTSQQDLVSDEERESTRAEKPRKVKSVRSSLEISRSNSERKEAKVFPRNTTTLESKVKDLESRVKKLEGELCEAAAIEAALFSVVAEHASSSAKVHAPARRLLRLYLHACRGDNHLISRRANAAKSAVSGLVTVAKACGNDVPRYALILTCTFLSDIFKSKKQKTTLDRRLTYWLSNTIILRAIISDNHSEELPVSAGQSGPKTQRQGSSSLTWKDSSLSKKDTTGGWDDPGTFITALEKVEAWIFSRVVESIWWQVINALLLLSSLLFFL